MDWHRLFGLLLIDEFIKGYAGEGLAMPYTMEDFRRDYAKEHFKDLTPQEQQEAIKSLTPEQLLQSLTPEQLERLRQPLPTKGTPGPRKKRQRRP